MSELSGWEGQGQLQLDISVAAKEGAYVGLRRTVQWEVRVGAGG